MNLCKTISVIIILCAAIKKSSQSCIHIADIFQYHNLDYPIIQNWPGTSILCQHEIITSDFHHKIAPTKYTLSKLEINETNSPEIATGAFVTLSNITSLRIKDAGVQVIHPGAFKGLTNLNLLSLQHNKIATVEEHYFTNLTQLSYLDLSSNNIVNISETSFSTLRSLQILYLRNNSLTKLLPNVFKNVTYISLLDLSFNKLTTLDSSLFRSQNLLKELLLNNNNLRTMYNLSFKMVLEILNCSYNIIQSLNFSQHTNIFQFDISWNGISSLEKISFKNSQIKEIYFDNNYLGQQIIKDNMLTDLAFVDVVSVKSNKLVELKTDLFKNIKTVARLILEHNFLHDVNFELLPPTILELYLSFNNLNSKLNITTLIHLQVLDISFNNLTKISFNFLNNLKKMLLLNLSNNHIVNLQLGCFRSLQRLINLDLSYNNLSVLPLGVFMGLENLNYLDMSYNQFKNVHDNLFHNLRSIETLKLSYNNLKYDNVKNSISELQKLKYISLAGNDWFCSDLSNILRNFRNIRITNAENYNVTNIDGVACKKENDLELISSEKTNLESLNSKLILTVTLLVLLLVVMLLEFVTKYVITPLLKNLKTKRSKRENAELLEFASEY